MALVSNIQLQNGAVKPPNLDTNLKYTAAGLTATEAIAVGTVPVSTSGSITVKSANDIRNWIQTTKTDGNVEIYMSNDARPDWALRVAGTADNAFVIANSYGSNCTAQFPAFSIGGAGAVGIGKTGATNTLDIAYKNAATGGIQILQTQNNVGAKLIAESTSASIGSTSNHKFGFRVNGTTVAAFNTSTQFGIGTDSPGATLDVRGAAIFNEAGAAVDFRIEGDAEQNLFFVDGSADAIGMGTATPVDTSRLHVMGTDGDAAATHSGDAMLIVENCGTTFLELATGNGNHAGLTFSDAAAATRGAVLYDHGTGLGGAADTMHFQTAGSIRAVIDSSGEVGIGTLAPASALHLAGVDDPEIRIQGAADGDPQVNFYQSTNCRGTIMYKDTGDNFVMDSDGKVTLQTSSTPRLVITNAGCVGIGTNAVASACGAELEIFSAGASTGLLLRSGNSSAASATIMGEGYRANGDSEQVLQVVGRNRNAGINLGIFEVASESLHCLGALELKTFDGSSMTTKMKITSGGNVGVGTATPAGKFHVEGSCAVFNPVSANAGKLEIVQGSTHADSIRLNATGTVNMYLEYRGYNGHVFVVDSTEAMRILHDGSSARVGIGTTAPAFNLHVNNGSSDAIARISTAASGEFAQLQFVNSHGCYWYQTLVESDCSLRFYNGADRISFFADGKIGITTNSAPAELLTVHCTAACDTALAVYNTNTTSSSKASIKVGSGSSNHLHIYRQGNLAGIFYDAKQSGSSHQFQIESTAIHTTTATGLGIGTTVPAYKLESSCSSQSTSYPLAVKNPDESTCISGVGILAGLGRVSGGTQYYAMMTLCKEQTWTTTASTIKGSLLFSTPCNESGVERMRITSGGCVGIGTTAPSEKLDVFGGKIENKRDGGGFIHLVRDDSSGAENESLGIIDFISTDASTGSCGQMARIKGAYDSAGDSAKLQFFTGGSTGSGTPTLSEAMTILSGGGIGIGTCAPVGRLDIQGCMLDAMSSIATLNCYALVIRNCSASGTGGGIAFGNDDGSVVGGSIVHVDQGSAQTGALAFFTREAGGNVTEGMRINNSQQTEVKQLGIGTCNPQRLLHLQSSGGAFARFTSENTDDFSVGANGNGFVVYNETDANYPFVIDNTGKVGIATTAPLYPLDVRTSSGHRFFVRDSSTSAGGEVQIQAGNDADSATTPLKLSACRFFFENGPVGIGNAPSTNFGSAFRVLQIGPQASINVVSAESATNHMSFSQNAEYDDATNDRWEYITTGGYAANYYMYQGSHNWRVNCDAGTSGNEVTWINAMKLSNDGNLGIATTAPNARLSIQANASNEGMELQTPSSGSFQIGVHNVGGSSGTAIEFRRGGSDGFDTLSAIIDASGNIGVGTGVVCDNGVNSKVLHIHGTTGHGTLHLTTTSSGTTNADGLIISQCAANAFIINRDSGNMYFRTADANRLIINDAGNVSLGPGAADPTASLNVTYNPALHNGLELKDCRGTNCRFMVTNSGSSAGLYVTDNGSYGAASITIGTANAGVGTSTPCCTFHVYGEATIGKGQGQNASAKLDLMSTSSAGYGGVLQGTTNNGVDWQVGHSKGVASSGFETQLRLQSTTGIIFGACNIGSTSVEHMFLCSNGVLGIGIRPLGTVFWEGGYTSKLQVAGTGPESSITVLRQHSLYGPSMILARNGGSPETNTLVDTGEGVGGVNFQANDGGKYVQVAAMNVHVGDRAGSSCMSGNIRFTLNGGSNGSMVERMRITQCGRVGIGTTAPNPNLHVVGSIGSTTHMTAQGGIYFSVAPGAEFEPVRITTAASGGGTCTLFIGNAAIQTSSDIRVKNNVQCYTCSAVDVLENARVVEFEYDKEKISDNSDFGPASRGKYVGLIAQEMIEYARWAINDGEGDPEGEHIWKAEYQHMVPLLIKAVQELNERVAELEAAA